MGTSGFDSRRGLAYPPNVAPELEPWFERVRITLEDILESSVLGARIISVELAVGSSGDVSALIVPNENTRWIKYYGTTTAYPTVADILNLGTETRVWANAGETHDTGTIDTVSTGDTFYFGVVAYQEEIVDQSEPSGSPSVPVYAEITFTGIGADIQPLALFTTEFDGYGNLYLHWSAQTSGTTGIKYLTDQTAYPLETAVEAETAVTSSPVTLGTFSRGETVYLSALPVGATEKGSLFTTKIYRELDDDELPSTGEISSGGRVLVTPVMNSSGGAEGTAPGWLFWGEEATSFYHPNGSTFTIPANTVTRTDLYAGIGRVFRLIAFAGTNSGRFTDLISAARVMVAIKRLPDGSWVYYGQTGWNAVTFNENDCVLGSALRNA